MVNGVSQGMGVLDGRGYRRRGRAVLGLNLGHPIVSNEDSTTWLFPNSFGQYLFFLFLAECGRLSCLVGQF